MGKGAAALIDTGLGVANIKKTVEKLTPLPVTVLTTHAHWDHIGAHRYFDRIAVHEAEKDWLTVEFPMPPEAVKRELTRRPCDFPEDFSVDGYRIFKGAVQKLLRDGERICLGDRTLTVIHTPGHSPGHCCFYEPDRKYLYSGDLIYGGCLDAFYPTTDPRLFALSVKKVRRLAVDRVLPAHHRLELSAGIIDRVERAFSGLQRAGKLKQGSGVFDFGEFQIHI